MGIGSRVTGSWSGQYTYGDGYDGIGRNAVPFDMSLTESWFRRITGYLRILRRARREQPPAEEGQVRGGGRTNGSGKRQQRWRRTRRNAPPPGARPLPGPAETAGNVARGSPLVRCPLDRPLLG